MNYLSTPQLGQTTANTPIVISIIEPKKDNELNKGIIVVGAVILAMILFTGSK